MNNKVNKFILTIHPAQAKMELLVVSTSVKLSGNVGRIIVNSWGVGANEYFGDMGTWLSIW